MKGSYEHLQVLCKDFLKLSNKTLDKLELYLQLLIQWNKKINLTAITEPGEIVIKHFYDCLLFLKHVNIPQNAKIIDVGTGAGFPGMVLKIARPDIELTLIDSLNKRLNFLKEVGDVLELDVKLLHARAEDAGANPLYREKFDIATARAVAKLNVLSEYCVPFVKVGGSFVAMKGPAAAQELTEANAALKKLGSKIVANQQEVLPDGSTRHFVIFKKISQTPTVFPRISQKILKKPL